MARMRIEQGCHSRSERCPFRVRAPVTDHVDLRQALHPEPFRDTLPVDSRWTQEQLGCHAAVDMHFVVADSC